MPDDMLDYTPRDRTPLPPRPPRPPASIGGIILAIIIAVFIIGTVASHVSQSVQVTTCIPGNTYCTQTSYPVQTP